MDRLNSTTKRTGAATAGPGGVAVTGSVHGGISMGAPLVARSAYRQQVRRIAPERLLDRDAELAELAEFCHSGGGLPYLWWQAPAWAGKSALMSWFALNSPDTVTVVSFFITARFAGHNDRMAFVDVVLEQLSAVAGEPLPGFLTEATKEAHLLDMLDAAAAACARQGRRLVLVVDGLDEDLGVTVGPDAYSVAALLPVQPPANVRIVVTGRPHPPVPSDVPDNHPLREAAIVRRLEISPHAQVIMTDAERELKRLLHGRPAEQDLLGLVAAAGGGLSAEDLAQLTGWGKWEVEQHMRAVSGRTFARRANRWQPGTGPDVYVLAHEELQSKAVECLGPARLTDYRERLHKWADGYRTHAWPADTPEYLLRGYFLLLQAIGAHDLMLACALDQVRHDRMLDVTGGDAAALAEIVTVQHLMRDAEPDLAALLRLAVARERLTSRNAHLPVGLPALWARLGDLRRAEALARSIVEPGRQAEAFSLLLRAAAGGQDTARLAQQGEAAAHLVTDPYRQAQAMVRLVGAVAASGDFDRAERLVHAIDDSSRRPQALLALVRAVATSGDLGRAEKLARSLSDPVWRTRALVDLVASAGRSRLPLIVEESEAAVAALGDGRRFEEWVRLTAALSATGDIEAAEAFARRATSLHLHVASLVAVLHAAPGDDRDRLDGLADRAMRLAEVDPGAQWTQLPVTISSMDRYATAPAVNANSAEWRARELADLAVAAAGRCSADLVRKIAGSAEAVTAVTGTPLQEEERADLAVALARIGDHDRAAALLGSVHDPGTRAGVLMRQLIAGGQVDPRTVERAEELIAGVPDGARQARLLVELAGAAILGGRRDHARRLAERAESVARSIAVTDWHAKERVERALVRAALATRDFRRAAALAGSASSVRPRDALLAEVAAAAARGGDLALAEEIALRIATARSRGRALIELLRADTGDRTADGAGAGGAPERLAEEAEKLARSLVDPQQQAEMLSALMQALAEKGATERALAVTRWFADPQAQAQALTALLNLVLARGDQQIVRAVVSHGVAATRSISSTEQRVDALIEIVRAAVRAGDAYWTGELAWQAEQMTRWIIEPDQRARSLTALVRVVATSGEHTLTGRLTARVEAAIELVEGPPRMARALIELTAALAACGSPQEANRLAARAESALGSVADAYQRACLQVDLMEALATTTCQATLLARIGLDPEGAAGPGAGSAVVSPWRIVHPDQRARALTALARAAAARGHTDAAVRIAGAVTDPYERDRALTGAARAAAAGGDLERAAAFTRHISAESRAALLLDLMRDDPARAGRLSGRAMAAILDLADPDHRAELLTMYAQALAAAGDRDGAEAAARTIPDVPTRARALAGIATRAEPAGARRLAAEILGTEAWTTSLGVLARLEPTMLTGAADDLLRPR
ncbi:hypothetical protein [Nonomuraea sp. KM90]|uniref:hypothetical protein n=1 Tax=Nonomuraea sp. KM90 TaxID=3457428 RepID=UPI003FCEC757